ncbi:MAG: hypothetical protein CSA68_07985 [Rhodobacterales bacterium]|nr:MAG: hypothetical protein CSA68_07985 [Rhodobacterales bacterium]
MQIRAAAYRTLLLGLVCGSVAWPGRVPAQPAGATPGAVPDAVEGPRDQGAAARVSILVINQDRLFRQSLYGERIMAEIQAEKAKLEAAIRQIEADLETEEKALTEQRPKMTTEAFRKLADAFDEKVQGIRKTQQVKGVKLAEKLEHARGEYYQRVLPILAEVMKERGAQIVLDQRMVFASDSSVDITDIVAQRSDATIGDGTAPPGPADPK